MKSELGGPRLGDIVNLRRVRKQHLRLADAAQAQENRLRFGQSKADRELAAHQQLRAAQALSGHRREVPTGPRPDADDS